MATVEAHAAHCRMPNIPILTMTLEMLRGGRAQSLFDGRDAGEFWFRKLLVCQIGSACGVFTGLHFMFLRYDCAIYTHYSTN